MESDLIQMTLALAEWKEFTTEAMRKHARAEDQLAGITPPPGSTTGSRLVVRDLRESAVLSQTRGLEALARAIDCYRRMPYVYNDDRAIGVQLEDFTRQTIVNYLTLQELVGRKDVVDLTRALWLQMTSSEIVRVGIASAFPLPAVGETAQLEGEAAQSASAATATYTDLTERPTEPDGSSTT